MIESVIKELLDLFVKDGTKNLSGYDKLQGSYTGIINDEELEKLNHFYEFQNCFFSDSACYYLSFAGKRFNRCMLAISYIDDEAVFMLKNNTFFNCVLYVSGYLLDELFSGWSSDDILKFQYENKVIVGECISTLCEYFNNDLSIAPVFMTDGLYLDGENLKGIKLPTHRDFFKKRFICKCIFPEIDFIIYNLDETHFAATTFDDKSNFSNNFWYARFSNCKLPIIDFNKIPILPNKRLSYKGCKFAEGTVFPCDRDFFEKNDIDEAYLPSYDYSDYCISLEKLLSVTFHSNAKLPGEYLLCKNFKYVPMLNNIPTEYLKDCVRFAKIKFPKKFIQKYNKHLSKEDIFILYNKYPNEDWQ